MSKINLANLWAIKWNIFNLTNQLLMEARHRNEVLDDLRVGMLY